ncbi:family 16 glycosylhydrolase [Caulobacter sp. S45]|uniref:glycoside hydrolase family 16 protein n=1 Tax=Caulobacter sp. S45 TaxID=1641861 RepID=UPI00131BFC0B|nr:glycoside hydrolase family 16 protein [Caulobacter sp. S45]
MKFSFVALAGALYASAASAQAPATIDPTTLGPQTFQDTFKTLDAGPDATAAVQPLHTWRTILQAPQTPPTADCCSDSTNTWFGSSGDGLGSPPAYVETAGLVIAATRQAQPFGRTWRSQLLNTKFSFSQLYGYFEINAQMPTCVPGTWPAFWLLPETGVWPLHGEIDAPEIVGAGIAYWTVHSDALGVATSNTVSSPVSCTLGFHTYGVLWTANTIAYYVDRKLVGQTPTPGDYTVPMYLLLDLNIGGAWPGQPSASLTEQKMVVREVDAWSWP